MTEGTEFALALRQDAAVQKDLDEVPTRVAMLARLEEIEKTYAGRLAHQKDVIASLDAARIAALDVVAAWEDFGQWVNTLMGDQPPAVVEAQKRAAALLSKATQ